MKPALAFQTQTGSSVYFLQNKRREKLVNGFNVLLTKGNILMVEQMAIGDTTVNSCWQHLGYKYDLKLIYV